MITVYNYDDSGNYRGESDAFINPRDINNPLIPRNSTLNKPPSFDPTHQYLIYSKENEEWLVKENEIYYLYDESKSYSGFLINSIPPNDYYTLTPPEDNLNDIEADKYKYEYIENQKKWIKTPLIDIFIYDPKTLEFLVATKSKEILKNSTTVKPPKLNPIQLENHKLIWYEDKKEWKIEKEIDFVNLRLSISSEMSRLINVYSKYNLGNALYLNNLLIDLVNRSVVRTFIKTISSIVPEITNVEEQEEAKSLIIKIQTIINDYIN